MKNVDVIIIGAGAAGLMCAMEAGKRQRRVLVLEHANKPGKKILMSGGGRCNFTNYHINPERYLSHNPHFCKSALSRYTQWDFIDLVQRYHIPFHEKTLGQLFCDNKATDILNMLLTECQQAVVDIRLHTVIEAIVRLDGSGYRLKTNIGEFQGTSLVIACGGLSIPTMGASPFGYQVAAQFDLNVWPTRAGLVPLTWHAEDKQRWSVLSGISVDTEVSNHRQTFREQSLFTHRGLSGPAMLQFSSYWQPGEMLNIDMLPEHDLVSLLKAAQQQQTQKQLKTVLATYLPKRLLETFLPEELAEKKIQTLTQKELLQIAALFKQWQLKPNGTEGYRTAEVTIGGVDCAAISSKTMEVNHIPGLYFIGEVLDVSGWLGGYNFQWAWSSGWAAGQVV